MATEVGDSLARQSTGVQSPPLSRPWRGSEYDRDYEQVWQYVLTNRHGGHPTRFIEAVRYVYGDDYTNTEYKRLGRFVSRCDWFHVVDCGGYKEVEPTTKGLGLESTVSISQNRRTGAGSDTSHEKLGKTGSDTSTTDTTATAKQAESYPKDRVNKLREKVVRLDGGSSGHDYRHEVFRELAQYREDTADKFTLLRRRITEEYLLLPYTTRFNTRHKAKASQSRFRTALDRASEDFRMASVLTLTVNPTLFESHTEATEAITDGVANLKSCLRTEYRTGGFEVLCVPDFQRNGLPHIHLVLFGVRVVDEEHNESGKATVSEAEIREYWDSNAGIGSQVAVQPAWTRGGDWVLHDDDKRVSLRYYLGKRIRELIQVAEMDEAELWQTVDSGDIELWRHALFWVTGKQYVSCSGSLKESKDGDDLPYAPAWEYVGTARYDQIPTHIIENATVVRTRSRTSATG